MSALDEVLDQVERAMVGVFVRRFDERARAIRVEVGDATGGEAAMQLRAAGDLERCAAAVASLLPPDPPGTVTILPPAATLIGEPVA